MQRFGMKKSFGLQKVKIAFFPVRKNARTGLMIPWVPFFAKLDAPQKNEICFLLYRLDRTVML